MPNAHEKRYTIEMREEEREVLVHVLNAVAGRQYWNIMNAREAGLMRDLTARLRVVEPVEAERA